MVQEPKRKLIAITVKLEPALYEELKRVGLRTHPATSSQAIMVDALKAYLQARQAEGS
jgi:predicted transcriptional regulator